MSLQKPLHDLTRVDLEQHRIWRYVTPEEPGPAELVEPYTKRGVAPIVSFVRCIFTTADNATYTGFGLITKLALVAPVIVTDGGLVPFHYRDGIPTRSVLAESFRRLHTSPEHFFPVTFRVDAPVRNQPVWNSFPSFTYRGEGGQVQPVPLGL